MPQFKPRERKHKVRRRLEENGSTNLDSNAAEILPATQRERKIKHDAMKKELQSQQPKMSSKKQKRLDKYIVRSGEVSFRRFETDTSSRRPN